MPKSKTVVGKYVFLDIVSYSYGRTVEAQSDVIDAINKIVKESLQSLKIEEKNRILIPTGDGICIALLDITNPFDIHVQLALKILELLNKYNKNQKDSMRQFKVRIGINENTDNFITDINNHRNVAGAGITEAQRIMDQAEGGNIFLGRTVYNHLCNRERYINKFKGYTTTVKRGVKLEVYQFIDPALEYLNSEISKYVTMVEAINTIKSKGRMLKSKIFSLRK